MARAAHATTVDGLGFRFGFRFMDGPFVLVLRR
jgi:hypothetical protein